MGRGRKNVPYMGNRANKELWREGLGVNKLTEDLGH